MPNRAKLFAAILAIPYLLLTAHSMLNHSVRVAYIEELGLDSLPTLTSKVLPVVAYSPMFLVGLIPALVVLFPQRRTKRESVILLSVSTFALVIFAIWMARLYVGIDMVYLKFQPI